MSHARATIARLRRFVGASLGRTPDDDDGYLTTLHEQSVPLPPGAERELRPDNPRLLELRRAYEQTGLPVLGASRWSREAVDDFLDLRWFRGETLITWHYREARRISELKFFVLLSHVRERDELGLLDRLDEDGAFGCWTFSYPGHGRVSRDLLDSVNELSFLERELRLTERDGFSVLDIGAGYGRLAHRMAAGFPNLRDYCCVDAIPESTFVSDYYLRHRGCVPPARVARLDELGGELAPGSFDLAVNIHSFSECTLAAIAWWVELLRRLEVPRLLVIPNEPDGMLSLEPDGSRLDFAPLLADAGYRLVRREPVLADPAVEELVGVRDRFHLFALES
jgi:SAM-dependent methyltransferase